jgi:hypothetical protein
MRNHALWFQSKILWLLLTFLANMFRTLVGHTGMHSRHHHHHEARIGTLQEKQLQDPT